MTGGFAFLILSRPEGELIIKGDGYADTPMTLNQVDAEIPEIRLLLEEE